MNAEPDVWPPRERFVGIWLLTICALVLAMILVGGATRLTDSGLSITEWNFMKHIVPPTGAERWAEEFALYQRTMEYQSQNNGMNLEEFKQIYWWEWAHRFLGTAIGLMFAVPALVFLLLGRLRGRFRVTALLFTLGAAQGAVGWWMVTSGLFDRLDVSPLRLAIHLAMALLILAIGVWTALGCFNWPKTPSRLGLPAWAPFALLVVLFVQALFGALLAGADGGPAYADWPRIGGAWVPPSAFGLEPFWHNFTEDHATQHLLHRTTGYVAALLALILALVAVIRGQGAARATALVVGLLAVLQVGLGIATVVTTTALHAALTHQAGAALLWIATIACARAVWLERR